MFLSFLTVTWVLSLLVIYAIASVLHLALHIPFILLLICFKGDFFADLVYIFVFKIYGRKSV